MFFTSSFAKHIQKFFHRKNLTSPGTPTYRFKCTDRADQVITREGYPLSISTVGSNALKLKHIGILIFINNRKR